MQNADDLFPLDTNPWIVARDLQWIIWLWHSFLAIILWCVNSFNAPKSIVLVKCWSLLSISEQDNNTALRLLLHRLPEDGAVRLSNIILYFCIDLGRIKVLDPLWLVDKRIEWAFSVWSSFFSLETFSITVADLWSLRYNPSGFTFGAVMSRLHCSWPVSLENGFSLIQINQFFRCKMAWWLIFIENKGADLTVINKKDTEIFILFFVILRPVRPNGTGWI